MIENTEVSVFLKGIKLNFTTIPYLNTILKIKSIEKMGVSEQVGLKENYIVLASLIKNQIFYLEGIGSISEMIKRKNCFLVFYDPYLDKIKEIDFEVYRNDVGILKLGFTVEQIDIKEFEFLNESLIRNLSDLSFNLNQFIGVNENSNSNEEKMNEYIQGKELVLENCINDIDEIGVMGFPASDNVTTQESLECEKNKEVNTSYYTEMIINIEVNKEVNIDVNSHIDDQFNDNKIIHNESNEELNVENKKISNSSFENEKLDNKDEKSNFTTKKSFDSNNSNVGETDQNNVDIEIDNEANENSKSLGEEINLIYKFKNCNDPNEKMKLYEIFLDKYYTVDVSLLKRELIHNISDESKIKDKIAEAISNNQTFNVNQLYTSQSNNSKQIGNYDSICP